MRLLPSTALLGMLTTPCSGVVRIQMVHPRAALDQTRLASGTHLAGKHLRLPFAAQVKSRNLRRKRGCAAPTALSRVIAIGTPALTRWAKLWRASGAWVELEFGEGWRRTTL